MKKTFKPIISILFIFALIILFANTVYAEEQLDDVNIVTDMGIFKYHVFSYPSMGEQFYLFGNSQISFKVANGEYFWIDMPFTYTMNTDRHIDIFFYNPDGEYLGSFGDIRINSRHNIPRNNEDYEFIEVKLVNHSKEGRHFRFFVWQGIEEIIGVPAPTE